MTRHADIVEVSSQPERFSSQQGLILGKEGAPSQPIEMVVTLDPPRHGPLRRTAMPRFTPRAIRSRHEEIDRIAVDADAVYIADFKSGAPFGATPAANAALLTLKGPRTLLSAAIAASGA